MRTIANLSWAERRLLAEAALVMLIAAACVAFVPFRVLGRFTARAMAEGGASAEGAEAIREVRWANRAIARRAPFRAKCFEQGLAAAWMLRHRGIANSLHYGVAKRAEDGLIAHVWVTSHGCDVIGCENKNDFHEFVRFQFADENDRTASRLRPHRSRKR